MRDTDESLLKSYVTARDERAFRLLAERYLGLIFHVALRRTRNRQLAEEVSQNILCAIAKKAGSLSRKPDLLPAWIHRATLFEASKAMRSEAAHQRRKEMPPPDMLQESDWGDVLTHLDAAIDKLPDADRTVLLLHYFENRPFPSIAQSLGKTQGAVQKQSQRALEKLSRLLKTKGVALSVISLAAGLTAESAKAAPLALIKTASASALLGSSTYSTSQLTFMFAMKSKAMVPAAVVLCAIPLTLQQMAISRTEERISQMQTIAAVVPGQGQTPRSDMLRQTSTISSNTDLMVLIREQQEAKRVVMKREAFEEKMAALPIDELVRLLKECARLKINKQKKSDISGELIKNLGQKDARMAILTTVELFGFNAAATMGLGDALVKWTREDPAAAVEWLNAQTASLPSGSSEALASRNFREPIFKALLAVGSAEAEQVVASTPEWIRAQLFSDLMGFRYSMGNVQSDMQVTTASLSLMRIYLPSAEWEGVYGSLASNLYLHVGQGFQKADGLYANPKLTSGDKEMLAAAIARQTLAAGRQPYDPALEHRVETELKAWLQKTVPQQADQFLAAARSEADERNITKADRIIDELRQNRPMTDDEIAQDLTRSDLSSRYQDALDLAGKIKDQQQRNKVIQELQTKHRPNP